MKSYFIIAALLLLVGANVQGQPGTLNTAFGTNGVSLTDLSAGNRDEEQATGVFVQPDGKRVVVVDRYPYIQLIRFNSDGSYDNTYGQGGFSQAVSLTHFGGPHSNAAMQSDGKIVVTGETPYNTTTLTDIGVARFNTDGTLDAGFGSNGIVTTDLNYWDEGDVVRIQPDGKIVVAGETLINNITYVAFARYNTDGSPDATFGDGGTGRHVNPIPSTGFELGDMQLTPDGKIMVLGDNGSNDFLLARFLSNGQIDVSFTSDGYEGYDRTDWGVSYPPFINCMDIQSDGKILLGGSLYNGVNSDLLVARYNSDGTIDNTFHSDGIQTTQIGGSETVYDLAVQGDGKIIAAGNVYYGSSQPMVFALARYEADGDLDGTFGVQGTQITGFSGYQGAAATNLVIHSDGDITAAGAVSQGLFSQDVAVATYDVQGSPDVDGYPVQRIIAFYADNGSTVLDAMAMQPDGKLVAAGYAWNGIDYDFLIARFNTNGSLDQGFGNNGYRLTEFTADGKGNEYAQAVAIQADGKIIAAGWFQDLTTSYTYFAVTRYNADGSLDPSFDGDGMKLVNPPGVFEEGRAIAIQPDGKILIGGDDLNSDWDFILFRLNTDGSLDGNFGTSGVVTTNFGYQDEIFGLALQSDGKILATGNTSDANSFAGFDFCTVRYNGDGTIDNGFGTNGRVTTDFGGGIDFADGIALQSDGKFVVGGGGPISSNYEFALARYNSNGTPDATFGTSGVQTTGFGGYDIGMSVAIQSDGNIVLAGFTEAPGSFPRPEDIALARYTTNGVLDTHFGTGGKVTTDLGAQELVYSMGLFDRLINVTGYKHTFNTYTLTDKYYGLAASYIGSLPPDVQVKNVINEINALSIASGTRTSLNSKLQAALTCLAANDIPCACSRLRDFINEVKAQAGKKKLTSAQATQLIAEATYIMSQLGCATQKTDETVPEAPTQYVLWQNYPNPFNPATQIRYGVPEPTHVRLVVYDVLGQEVAVLVDEDQSAGFYDVVWNGTNKSGATLSSGAYFFRLTAGSFSQLRKMMLVR